jgi:hypothetical protein
MQARILHQNGFRRGDDRYAPTNRAVKGAPKSYLPNRGTRQSAKPQGCGRKKRRRSQPPLTRSEGVLVEQRRDLSVGVVEIGSRADYFVFLDGEQLGKIFS